MNKTFSRNAIFLAAALTPSAAFAHPGHSESAGFAAGFMHPLGGLDHMLAMAAVGLLAFQIGGRALWLIPAAFIVFMTAGGGLGMASVHLPFVEAGIALSVVVLGALVALSVKGGAAFVALLVAAFAVFHGHAHGMEMPAAGSAFEYALGFVSATALLHAAGAAIGFLLAKASDANGGWIARGSGAAAACVGMMMLTGQI